MPMRQWTSEITYRTIKYGGFGYRAKGLNRLFMCEELLITIW